MQIQYWIVGLVVAFSARHVWRTFLAQRQGSSTTSTTSTTSASGACGGCSNCSHAPSRQAPAVLVFHPPARVGHQRTKPSNQSDA